MRETVICFFELLFGVQNYWYPINQWSMNRSQLLSLSPLCVMQKKIMPLQLLGARSTQKQGLRQSQRVWPSKTKWFFVLNFQSYYTYPIGFVTCILRSSHYRLLSIALRDVLNKIGLLFKYIIIQCQLAKMFWKEDSKGGIL